MGITYKVEWLQEICGISFCVARTVYEEKEAGKIYELFALKHGREFPVWAHDISIAEYSVGRYFEEDFTNKGTITEYFQGIIQQIISENVREVYEYIEDHRLQALTSFYPTYKIIKKRLPFDRHELEAICKMLVEVSYLKAFYTTKDGIAFRVTPKNSYEKFFKIFLS